MGWMLFCISHAPEALPFPPPRPSLPGTVDTSRRATRNGPPGCMHLQKPQCGTPQNIHSEQFLFGVSSGRGFRDCDWTTGHRTLVAHPPNRNPLSVQEVHKQRHIRDRPQEAVPVVMRLPPVGAPSGLSPCRPSAQR